MHAETVHLRRRIDQAAERRAAVQREIIALRVKRLRDRAAALDRARDARGVEAGRVDDRADVKLHRLGAADVDLEPVAGPPRRDEGGVESEARARRLGVAAQSEHVGVAVDDARGR